MTTPRVIIRGRHERREFCEPFRQCIEMLEKSGVEYHVNPTRMSGGLMPPDELAFSGEPTPPDFVLFFQSYPHEFPKAELAQLRRNNPFAPFFYVLGVCCEGMLRTAGPLDSPFYCYAHGWSGREIEQMRLFLTDQPSLFSLPLTAGGDEIAQWVKIRDGRRQTADGSRGAPAPLVVCPSLASAAVCCLPSAVSPAVCRLPSLILTHFGPFGNDSAMNRLLAEEHERLGYETLFSGKTLPDVFTGRILADADDSPPEKILESIQRLRRQFADNDFTVYVDSPRIDEKNGYVQAGVTRVLPKIR